jgi:hypothetical protein
VKSRRLSYDQELRLSSSELAKQQGATTLLAATFAFLRRNKIPEKLILESARLSHGSRKLSSQIRQHRKLVRAYEDMGTIMSTWFSKPRFLDKEGRPLPLSAARGTQSIPSLVRSSRAKISAALAVELMRRSPSVRIDSHGKFFALKRVFVLPEFEVTRAALIIERYLDTLRRNSSAHINGTTLLLERNCHVSEIDPKRIIPILRDIRGRGTAFMDSVDGDIEAHRIRKPRRKAAGELGVLVFAWTRPSKPRRSKLSLAAKL